MSGSGGMKQQLIASRGKRRAHWLVSSSLVVDGDRYGYRTLCGDFVVRGRLRAPRRDMKWCRRCEAAKAALECGAP